jgi:hypothetical protein
MLSRSQRQGWPHPSTIALILVNEALKTKKKKNRLLFAIIDMQLVVTKLHTLKDVSAKFGSQTSGGIASRKLHGEVWVQVVVELSFTPFVYTETDIAVPNGALERLSGKA